MLAPTPPHTLLNKADIHVAFALWDEYEPLLEDPPYEHKKRGFFWIVS